MKFKTLLISVVMLLAAFGSAQTRLNINWLAFLKPTTFANLPTSPFTNQVWAVNDCATAACTAGGGSIQDILIWNGSSWVVYATSASGGGSISFPQVISGTVNSGGIVYNSDTTHMASSAAQAAGTPVLWGGAGTQPGTGTVGVGNGGTGLTSGTSGGVLCFTATGTIASSNALGSGLAVQGNGAGVCPTTSSWTLGSSSFTFGGAAGTAITWGKAASTSSTAAQTYGVGSVTGSTTALTAGDVTFQASNNTATGATETGGTVHLLPGAATAASAAATAHQGQLDISIVCNKDTTSTVGLIQVYTTAGTTADENKCGDASGTSAVAFLGVATALSGTANNYVTIRQKGQVTATANASSSFTMGHFACLDTTNGVQFVVDSSTPCATGTYVGVVKTTATTASPVIELMR